MSTFLYKASEIEIKSDHPWNDSRFKQFKADFPDKIMRLEPEKNPVSAKLRAYYWGAVLETVRATVPEWSTLEIEDVHEILKKEFNSFQFFSVINKRTERVGRSAVGPESNSGRAMDYIERIGQWLGEEYYVTLPNPREYLTAVNEAKLK